MHTDPNRAILAITGEDRRHFLQGLLTQDLALLKDERGLFAALLSPQGKIIHDLFLLQQGDRFLVDCASDQKAALIKRLTMYKLRAKVGLELLPDWRVAYRLSATHAAVGHVTQKHDLLILTDPRAGEMGDRIYIPPEAAEPKHTATLEAYHHHRLRMGIPESSELHDDVALDAGFDLLNAISYSKGCYVGQEVTARMHYKNIARRGFYCVEGESSLPHQPTPILANGVPIGELRGASDRCGIAMLKFAETEQALAANGPITVLQQPVRLTVPCWMQTKLAQFRAAQENQ